MADKQHIFSGAGAPGTTPTGIGHHYIDTTNNIPYISIGTASSADWFQVGSGSLSFPLLAPLNAQAYGFTGGDNDTYMGSTGDGNITFYANGFTRMSIDQNFTTIYELDVVGDLDVTGNISAANYPPTGSNNQFAYYDSGGSLASMPSWTFNTTTDGLQFSKTFDVNNDGYYTIHSIYVGINPLLNSPTNTVDALSITSEIDPSNTGFTVGTGGQASRIFSLYLKHLGSGDSGSLTFCATGADIGNGTDPITVNGLAYILGFSNIAANVTLTGGLQGFIFQPSVNASATIDAYVTALADQANIPTSISGYTSANLSPVIGSINNNNGFTSININPNVTSFTGNANYNGIGISGTFGSFGTGSWQGININSTVTSVTNAYGLFVDMSNITASGTKLAANFIGDVNIQGDLTFSGALAIGQLNAYASQAVVDGGGTPSTIHGLISAPTVGNGLTIANCDTIGVNTASLIQIGTGSTLTSGGFGMGIASLALPSLVQIGAGSSIDNVCGAVFAVNMAGGSGTLDVAKGGRSVFIGDGTTTVNRFYAWSAETLGLGATENWGIHAPSVEYNFMQSLKIGGTTGSTDKVTGVSNGLEFAPTKAFVATNVTNAEEAALTAVNGMIVYNTDTNKFRGYENGAWVDLV